MKKLYPTYPDYGRGYPKSVNLLELSVCNSTNTHIKSNIDSLIDFSPLIVHAKAQTAGRGRNGRKWFSAGSGGVYFSLLLKLRNKDCLGLLSIATGVSIIKAVNKIAGIQADLKWPNDIEISGKKVGGILIENQIFNNEAVSIVGIGLNVNNKLSDLPPEISKTASSLYIVSGEKTNIRKIVKNLTGFFFCYIGSIDKGETTDLIKLYSESLRHKLGDSVAFHDGKSIVRGNFMGIKDNGGLVLELSGGKIKTFFSGEILSLSGDVSG